MNRYGFLRITCASTATSIANPEANAAAVVKVLSEVACSDVVVFPELGLTGYTCADLFGQAALIREAERAAARVADATRGRRQLVVIGLPVAIGNSLFNCALAIADGAFVGLIPKQFLPNYKEFYEGRWFSPGTGREPKEAMLAGRRVPFGVDLLFDAGGPAVIGVEICEDLWMPVPPSSSQALAGATVLLNLSASNEVVGKSRYRTDLVTGQSGRCIAAYGYAGAGPTESTTDLVFGGHCLIAENGRLLAETRRVGDGGPLLRETHWVTVDVDVKKLSADRRATSSFDDTSRAPGPYRRVPIHLDDAMPGLKRAVFGMPFVPPEGPELHDRCAEVFGIQCAGLAQRVGRLPANTPLHIGVSGGLDSTLGLLVAVKTCDNLGLPRSLVRGITMPGFGTTERTRTNAVDLMEHLGVESETIDIQTLSLQTFRELNHAPFGIDCRDLDLPAFRAALAKVPREKRHDLVFENVQARLRTFLLMSRGFVIGTGDLSELALGWSTYNGDHMSMYNPNCSIPKTLVKFLVEYVARNEFEAGPLRETLLSIAATTISPELLPTTADGGIEQSTEDTLGPYEIHDFILFNAIRNGHSPEKILFLSGHATFSQPYPRSLVVKTMRTFYTRFFAQQYKRSCVPDGPKVGTVSLSPRGDWRMPSDAEVHAWLEGIVD